MVRMSLSTLLAILCFIAATKCVAQPLLSTTKTIDARVANADLVILATVDGLQHENDLIDKIGGDYKVTLKVKEVIKGKVGELVTDLPPVATLASFEQLEIAKTELVCFLGPKPERGQIRHWTYLLLRQPHEPGVKIYNWPILAPALTRELTILNTEVEILQRVRDYAKINQDEKVPASPATIIVRLPRIALLDYPARGDGDKVELPIDTSLEKLALQLINSPESFYPAENPFPNDWPYWEKTKSAARFKIQVAGIHCLKHFKSDSNTAILKKLLLEDPAVLGIGSGFKTVRHEALEVLLGWAIELDRPDFWQTLTDLDLSHSQANDKTMQLVGQLKNLTALNLTETQISHVGLEQLKDLKRLVTIELAPSQLTDSSVRTLNQSGMLHSISFATTPYDINSPIKRPQAATEVSSLTLWSSAITDSGLKEFAAFKNVIELDLRQTEIADQGLDHLNLLTNLSYLYLDDTAITNQGIKKLSPFKNLKSLSLKNLPINDAAIDTLTSLNNLKYINLTGTKVTTAGISKLKQALPETRIESSFDDAPHPD